MAKRLTKRIKLMAIGGKATPAPPMGPALGQAGVNIGDFVTKFNAASKDMMGEQVTVRINVYEDRSFDFKIVTSPASRLILKAAGIEKGSGKNALVKAGKITRAQAKEIAQKKMKDLTAHDLDQAAKIIEGTARSMGIEVK
ncbi:50S ribosomal protein L11 [Candidatus Parcubacteria bacterium]|nr:50S ribosomal protein L11 [Candidatus Parcubacteria bacterium]